MVDTVRTLPALQALLADNTDGNISPQDTRDFLVSTFPRMTSYVPVFTAAGGGFSVGDGTVAGAFAELGDMVYVTGRLVVGGSTNLGSGFVSVSLPVAADLNSNAYRARGEAFAFDSNTTSTYIGQSIINPGDLDNLQLNFLKPSVGDAMDQPSSTFPMTWATSDQLGFNIWYPKRAP